MKSIETIETLTESRATSAQPVGWAVDVDLANNPTYPMRDRHLPEEKGYSWERPTQQPESVEVLHSIERPNITAVFGTSAPPSGLSGAMRRLAYRYSESSNGHWVPLILADRVNMMEGILSDLARGHLPNVFKEAGWGVQWRHDRGRLLTKVGIMALLTAGIAAAVAVPRMTATRSTALTDELLGAPLNSDDVPKVFGEAEGNEIRVSVPGAPRRYGPTAVPGEGADPSMTSRSGALA